MEFIFISFDVAGADVAKFKRPKSRLKISMGQIGSMVIFYVSLKRVFSKVFANVLIHTTYILKSKTFKNGNHLS